MTSSRSPRWSLVALVLALSSCSVRRVAKSAAEGSADAAAERAAQPGPSPVGSAIGRVIDSPEVQQGVRDLARQSMVGAAEGIRTSQVVQQISPQIEEVIRGAIAGSLRDTARTLRSEGRQDLDEVTSALTESAARSVAAVLAEQHPSGLTPALAGLTRDVSREAVVGAGEGMRTLDPMGDASLRSKIYQGGLIFGEGFGRGMPSGFAENQGLLLLLCGLLAALGLLGGAALYALWQQTRATSHALLLLAQRLEGSRPEPPPPSRRPTAPRSPTPSLA